MKNRKDTNLILLQMISNYIHSNKRLRFGQVLVNLGIIETNEEDPIGRLFYEEPDETLARITRTPSMDHNPND